MSISKVKMTWATRKSELPGVGWLKPGDEFQVERKVAEGLEARGAAAPVKATGSKPARKGESAGSKP